MAFSLPILLLASPLIAQDSVGRWKGRMEPTNLSAELWLDLQHVGASWKAELTFRAGPDSSSLPIEELRVDRDSVLIRTRIEGADVRVELTHNDNLLLGTVRVTEQGRLLAEG